MHKKVEWTERETRKIGAVEIKTQLKYKKELKKRA